MDKDRTGYFLFQESKSAQGCGGRSKKVKEIILSQIHSSPGEVHVHNVQKVGIFLTNSYKRLTGK